MAKSISVSLDGIESSFDHIKLDQRKPKKAGKKFDIMVIK